MKKTTSFFLKKIAKFECHIIWLSSMNSKMFLFLFKLRYFLLPQNKQRIIKNHKKRKEIDEMIRITKIIAYNFECHKIDSSTKIGPNDNFHRSIHAGIMEGKFCSQLVPGETVELELRSR